MLAITGGSGVYQIPEVTVTERREVPTPFGMPSSPVTLGRLGETPVAFLARHGEGHLIPPHRVNYRANVWALRSLGATHLLAVSAVGSLREELVPGHFVVVDQFIDLTRRRETTFFNELAGHVSLADPVCAEFAAIVATAAQGTGVSLHRGGTYVCIDGPQFSTRAESHWYRQMGAEVIGMTNATEARLAREAGLHFSTLAMVTDYDCWKEEEEHVTVESVMAVMRHNGEFARRTVVALAAALGPAACRRCPDAIRGAVMTDLARVAPRVLAELGLLLPE